jgi:hypothetical protein
MFSNPITGRSFIVLGDSSNDNESALPDPSLTIAVLIFCILGPFWLIYRLVETLLRKSVNFTARIGRKILLLGGNVSD